MSLVEKVYFSGTQTEFLSLSWTIILCILTLLLFKISKEIMTITMLKHLIVLQEYLWTMERNLDVMPDLTEKNSLQHYNKCYLQHSSMNDISRNTCTLEVIIPQYLQYPLNIFPYYCLFSLAGSIT